MIIDNITQKPVKESFFWWITTEKTDQSFHIKLDIPFTDYSLNADFYLNIPVANLPANQKKVLRFTNDFTITKILK